MLYFCHISNSIITIVLMLVNLVRDIHGSLWRSLFGLLGCCLCWRLFWRWGTSRTRCRCIVLLNCISLICVLLRLCHFDLISDCIRQGMSIGHQQFGSNWQTLLCVLSIVILLILMVNFIACWYKSGIIVRYKVWQ